MGNSSFPHPCFLELLSVPKLDDADFLPVLMHFRCPLEFVSIDRFGERKVCSKGRIE